MPSVSFSTSLPSPWLWNQTLKAGGALPGHRVRLLHLDSDQAKVRIQGLAGDVDDRLVSVVVDATGARRVFASGRWPWTPRRIPC